MRSHETNKTSFKKETVSFDSFLYDGGHLGGQCTALIFFPGLWTFRATQTAAGHHLVLGTKVFWRCLFLF